MDWVACFSQLVRDPMGALSSPDYFVQYVGQVSPDNLGWVWQSNVFSHFVLVGTWSNFQLWSNIDFLLAVP